MGHGGLFNGSSQYLNSGTIDPGNAFTLPARLKLDPAAFSIQTLWANKIGGWRFILTAIERTITKCYWRPAMDNWFDGIDRSQRNHFESMASGHCRGGPDNAAPPFLQRLARTGRLAELK
jgi:hypothetical protein